jgi:hypothetical protein
MRRIAYPFRVSPDEHVDLDASGQGLTESRRAYPHRARPDDRYPPPPCANPHVIVTQAPSNGGNSCVGAIPASDQREWV